MQLNIGVTLNKVIMRRSKVIIGRPGEIMPVRLVVILTLLLYCAVSGGNYAQTDITAVLTGDSPAAMSAGTEKAYYGQSETVCDLQVTEVDWSDYFDGLTGAAVFYNPSAKVMTVFNPELANTRRSPCSTFKIVSALIGLEQGVIPMKYSTPVWSGEIFWNAAWNRDIDFHDAFRTSCVWYFRAVADELGKERIRLELNRLQYGNADISDWAGQLNTNDDNPALTGFWIESSLQISPAEQVLVMERIFGENTIYRQATIEQLRNAMRLPDLHINGWNVFGKTGMGKSADTAVDAWYTGFAEASDERVYFCVYLGQTAEAEISSIKAREIAIQLIADNALPAALSASAFSKNGAAN